MKIWLVRLLGAVVRDPRVVAAFKALVTAAAAAAIAHLAGASPAGAAALAAVLRPFVS